MPRQDTSNHFTFLLRHSFFVTDYHVNQSHDVVLEIVLMYQILFVIFDFLLTGTYHHTSHLYVNMS